MKFDRNRALQLLRIGTNLPDAEFHDGQEEAIAHVVESKGRLLVVQRTGWGKSVVYFIATKLLRESRGGPALLISPLLALMRNQITAAQRMGINAVTINSDNMEEWAAAELAVQNNQVDILLISPERLANERFRNEVLAGIADKISLLVVDEAHCISDWGHDFRPQYRLLERTIGNLPPQMRLLATTATANNRVMEDLGTVLGPELNVIRGDLNRPSLHLQSARLPSPAERLAWLAEQLPKIPGSGIIYTLTKRDANRVADWLQHCGIDAYAYTSDTGEARPELERKLLANEVKALVATTSLGMGFDKPDLAFVIHYQAPGSVVAYYQQVGRAGRAIDEAYGILLSGAEDTEITDFFIDSAFPTREEVQIVLAALESDASGLSVPDLMNQVNLGKERISKILELLSLESPSPVAKQGSKWQLTASTLGDSFWERANRQTDVRRAEQVQMQGYIDLTEKHMEFLIEALDGDASKVRTSKLTPLTVTVANKRVIEAVTFLRQTNLEIDPRKTWPGGGLPIYDVQGRILESRQAQPGKALCYWQDGGWGQLVYDGKYKDKRFSDELVEACAKMIEAWSPQPAPKWVTCIPSLKNPTQVPDFAERLAKRLGLPFHLTLEKTADRPEQKDMANSSQQARNVDGSLGVIAGSVQQGPVFLVDDMAKSKWTFTIGAWLLRGNGSGEVYPVAIALT